MNLRNAVVYILVIPTFTACLPGGIGNTGGSNSGGSSGGSSSSNSGSSSSSNSGGSTSSSSSSSNSGGSSGNSSNSSGGSSGCSPGGTTFPQTLGPASSLGSDGTAVVVYQSSANPNPGIYALSISPNNGNPTSTAQLVDSHAANTLFASLSESDVLDIVADQQNNGSGAANMVYDHYIDGNNNWVRTPPATAAKDQQGQYEYCVAVDPCAGHPTFTNAAFGAGAFDSEGNFDLVLETAADGAIALQKTAAGGWLNNCNLRADFVSVTAPTLSLVKPPSTSLTSAQAQNTVSSFLFLDQPNAPASNFTHSNLILEAINCWTGSSVDCFAGFALPAPANASDPTFVAGTPQYVEMASSQKYSVGDPGYPDYINTNLKSAVIANAGSCGLNQVNLNAVLVLYDSFQIANAIGSQGIPEINITHVPIAFNGSTPTFVGVLDPTQSYNTAWTYDLPLGYPLATGSPVLSYHHAGDIVADQKDTQHYGLVHAAYQRPDTGQFYFTTNTPEPPTTVPQCVSLQWRTVALINIATTALDLSISVDASRTAPSGLHPVYVAYRDVVQGQYQVFFMIIDPGASSTSIANSVAFQMTGLPGQPPGSADLAAGIEVLGFAKNSDF